jgi:hypothetical protein
MIALALALSSVAPTAQAAGAWQAMPADTPVPPMMFACFLRGGGFYDLHVRRNGDDDHIRIGHEPPGRNLDSYRRVVLRGALRSVERQVVADAVRYRLLYRGNDRSGVPTHISLTLSATPAESGSIRAATFTMVQRGVSATQECTRAPPALSEPTE